jgi:phosphopantetheinyl transferase (holo-ACP synthase)
MNKVRSCLEAISIKDTARDKEALVEGCFTKREIAKIQDGKLETICGNLAVKRAVKKVLGDGGISSFAPQAIEIGRSNNGAVEVLVHGYDNADNALRVSISHTKETAYGLAVYETGQDD